LGTLRGSLHASPESFSTMTSYDPFGDIDPNEQHADILPLSDSPSGRPTHRMAHGRLHQLGPIRASSRRPAPLCNGRSSKRNGVIGHCLYARMTPACGMGILRKQPLRHTKVGGFCLSPHRAGGLLPALAGRLESERHALLTRGEKVVARGDILAPPAPEFDFDLPRHEEAQASMGRVTAPPD
jgi:hypothetical protein